MSSKKAIKLLRAQLTGCQLERAMLDSQINALNQDIARLTREDEPNAPPTPTKKRQTVAAVCPECFGDHPASRCDMEGER